MKVLSKTVEIRTIYDQHKSRIIKFRDCYHQIEYILSQPYYEGSDGIEVYQEVLMLNTLWMERIITKNALRSQLLQLGCEDAENSLEMACSNCCGIIEKSEMRCPHCGIRVKTNVMRKLFASIWLGGIALAFCISVIISIVADIRFSLVGVIISPAFFIIAIIGLILGNDVKERVPINKKFFIRIAILMCIIAIVMTFFSCSYLFGDTF